MLPWGEQGLRPPPQISLTTFHLGLVMWRGSSQVISRRNDPQEPLEKVVTIIHFSTQRFPWMSAPIQVGLVGFW